MVRLRQRSRFRAGERSEEEQPQEAGREDQEGHRRLRMRRGASLERSRVRSRPVVWLAALFVLVLAAILLLG